MIGDNLAFALKDSAEFDLMAKSRAFSQTRGLHTGRQI